MPHIHEKIDFVVDIFIVHRNKVFLRKHDKLKIWLAVGGHIELDEDPNYAAIREAKEESGLDITLYGSVKEHLDENFKGLIPPKFLNIHNFNNVHKHIDLIYFATSDTDKINPTGGDRSDEWKWFTLEELEDPKYNLKKNIKFYAEEALKTLSSNP